MNLVRFSYRTSAVVAAVLLATLAVWADHANVEMCPALAVHAWHGQRHTMGVVCVTESGDLRFAGLYSEDSTEVDHPGYWMEEFKIEKLRVIFPSVFSVFQFGQKIRVDGVNYLRVLPARRTDRPPPGKPTSTTSSASALRAKPIIIA